MRIVIHPLVALLALATTCSNPAKEDAKNMSEHSHTNALIHETSPYLLQHAHNPVEWMPWGDEALNKARTENKPLLISIGYSACHWCHVMEHESFEDTAVARLMNEHFICIKVDREERPDVDQVYMDAVQLMTGGGGWPLNCFALPDGRPFFGGTYFPKDQWMQVLDRVNAAFTDTPEKVNDYANRLTQGIRQMEDIPVQPIPDAYDAEVLETAVARWQQQMDNKEGGPNRAPKFPLPNNYDFLLAYASTTGDQELLNHVHLTLQKMAFGGIYDQLGGGFARYSVDAIWKVPHFEKMLYDNGQLLSLYSNAYRESGNPLYRDVVVETAAFIKRELTSPEGAFYSALDADSEGEEGKYYVWTKEEVEKLSGDDWPIIEAYYNINGKAFWEHGNNILLRDQSNEAVANALNISETELKAAVARFKTLAMAERDKRISPGLDDKTLTSWNGLAIKGLADAYMATGETEWLDLARENADFLLKTQLREDGGLWHSYKKGESRINGYLEDYAHLCDALIRLHEATFDKTYLLTAHSLANYVQEHFEQNASGHLYFKSKEDEELVAKKLEINDNVIPASNSVMATCFHKLSLLMDNREMAQKAALMLAAVEPNFSSYPSGYSQWMMLQLSLTGPFHEVVVVGNDCVKKAQELHREYLPMSVLCGAVDEGDIPILEHRKVEGRTMLYVCQAGACQLPVETVDEALAQLHR